MSYFQEESRAFDIKDNFTDALHGRIEFKEAPRDPKEAGARRNSCARCPTPVL